jgi:hypothetical protein
MTMRDRDYYDATPDPIARRVRAEQAGKHLAEGTIRRIEAALDKQNARGKWAKLPPPPPPPTCDLCDRRAVWAHPAGGLRCGKCPRPRR